MKSFSAKNLDICEKSIIFAENFRRIIMAGRRIRMSAMFDRYQGDLGEGLYARTLVNCKKGVMAVCRKPQYTEEQKKEMAKRPQILRFNSVIKEAQAIYHDPELRAEWEKRHVEFQREARKNGEYAYPRLWDYIRHELNQAKQRAEK
jgi:hypothetical protein